MSLIIVYFRAPPPAKSGAQDLLTCLSVAPSSSGSAVRMAVWSANRGVHPPFGHRNTIVIALSRHWRGLKTWPQVWRKPVTITEAGVSFFGADGRMGLGTKEGWSYFLFYFFLIYVCDVFFESLNTFRNEYSHVRNLSLPNNGRVVDSWLILQPSLYFHFFLN